MTKPDAQLIAGLMLLAVALSAMGILLWAAWTNYLGV